MKGLQDLLYELRCDINYCKVSYENDTEIANANDTLLKVENLVKKLTIPVVVNQRELLLDFADYSESDKTSEATDECVDNYLDSIK